MSEFSKWLDEEIKELARYKDNNMMWGKHTEAIRIRQKLCEIDKTPEIDEESEYLKGQICDRYCRFPEAYDDNERMIEERCDHCPLERL